MDFKPAFFDEEYQRLRALFESDLRSYFHVIQEDSALRGLESLAPSFLFESVSYSLFSGGKRFRPVLALAMADALRGEVSMIFPWARAIEFVHTYSLIHDDLPALDNDDFRRGQPTNHKMFGEAAAILAGDGLLTEAFGCLAQAEAAKLPRLVSLLASTSGLRGMVTGQAMDIRLSSRGAINKKHLLHIHELKTARLIQASCEGAALLLGADEMTAASYGQHLGLSFQIADDILDKDKQAPQNLVTLMGECAAQDLLEYHVDQALQRARKFPHSEFLVQMALFNLSRKQ